MFIAAADLHLSETKPAYRIEENWIDVCLDKFMQIINCGNKNQCPIIIAGDFWDKSAHSPELLNQVMDIIARYRYGFYILPGNHDMKNKSIKLLNKSSVATLAFAGAIVINEPKNIDFYFDDSTAIEMATVIDFYPFGDDFSKAGNGEVAVIHEFAYQEKPNYIESNTGNYKKIIKRLGGQYKLVICGDNHEDFIAEYNGCTFLNCGAMLRTDRDEIDRKPCFYLVDNDLNVERKPFKITASVFDETAIELIRKKDEAIEKVTSRMSEEIKIDLNFKKNIQRRINIGDLDDEVVNIIKGIIQ